MPTTVVNVKTEKCDVYIGRPSVFGNPFSVYKYGRKQCIEKYRQYFELLIKHDPKFREKVLSLKGKKLGCFCKPLECHGDVIAEYVDKN